MDTFGQEKEGKHADLEVRSWWECAWKDTDDDGTFLLGRLSGSCTPHRFESCGSLVRIVIRV